MSATAPLGQPISVRLPEDLHERVEALATPTRRSPGDVVSEVLERELGFSDAPTDAGILDEIE